MALSAGLQGAIDSGGIGVDAYRNNINAFMAKNPTAEQTQQAMEQYGVSQGDVDWAKSYTPAKVSSGMTYSVTHDTPEGPGVDGFKTNINNYLTTAAGLGDISASKTWADMNASGTSADDVLWATGKSLDDWLKPKAKAATPGGVDAPAPNSYNLAGLQQSKDWIVDPKTQTVAGQLNTILASDSPLMQQARTRALQAQNASGRLNTSMAQEAADAAMYDTALKIATPDAQINADAGKTNAASTNQFSRDANGNLYDLNKMQTAHGYDMAKLAKQSEYDLAKIDKQGAAAQAVADIEAQYKNLTQGSASATSIVNKMQDSLTALMNNKDITDQAARDKLASDIKLNASDSLNMIGALAGDVDLQSYITQIGL